MRRTAPAHLVACLAVCLCLVLAGASCTGPRFGRLRAGMTQGEVRRLLGEPTGTTRERIGPDDLREVWVYHVPRLLRQDAPLYPEIRLVVFKNEKLIALDPPNPYRPGLK